MSKSNRQPIFVYSPDVVQTALATTANTARDGTGTITQIYQAAGNVHGSLAEVIKFIATGATTLGLINLFRKQGGTGNWMFVAQVEVAAVTPSATVKAWEGYVAGNEMPLRLSNGDTLGAAPTKGSEQFNALVEAGPLQNSDS
ncbi:MAG: hypothetical protein SFV21_00235 [Rhodospirillaceae bacterium]|nr:hypothetical protein [Rhodospirillaceae bacterium]